jgi:outer membrane protein TolC
MSKVLVILFICFFNLFSQSIEIKQDENSLEKVFSLQIYLEKLLEEDLEYKNRNLESKVTLLNSLIEQNRYNPDIYLSGDIQGQKTLDMSRFNPTTELEAIGKINFNMRLYDGQRSHYMNSRRELFENLSSLEVIDAKDQLQLLGVQIYTQLLQIQRTIQQYNILLKYQLDITDIAVMRASKDLGDIYDKTQSENDLINIQLRLSDLKELLIQKEYIFRQSINLESGAPIKLLDIEYKEFSLSLSDLQKKALQNNSHLHVMQKQYELSQSDIKTESDRRGIIVDWTSHYGFGHVEQMDSPYRSNDGDDWLALLSIKYPLYERDDIAMQVQNKKIKSLQSKNTLEIQKRALSRTINRLYNALQKHNIKNRLYAKQKEVLLERSTISYNRFKEALENYKPYSDSLRDMARSDEAYIQNALLVDATTLEIYILSGESLFGSN